jgi:hypothetical protein
MQLQFLENIGVNPKQIPQRNLHLWSSCWWGFLGQFWVNMPQVLDLQTHCDPLYPNQTYAHAYFGNHKLKKMCHASKIRMIQLGILQTWMIHYVDGSTFVDYTWMIHYRLTGA